MDTIKALTDAVLKFRDERDWRQFHTAKDMALSLMLEAGELAEHMQWRGTKEFDEYLSTHRGEIADELSDVLYWVLLMSHDFGINLADSFYKKLRENETKYPIEISRGIAAKYNQK